MKTAFYTRVSTLGQKEDKTIEAQIKTLRSFVSEPPVKIYRDEGETGSTLDRGDLGQMIEDANQGVFDVLYIDKWDRLARPDQPAQQNLILSALTLAGVKIFEQGRPLEDNPQARQMMDFAFLIGKQERENIKFRTSRARRQKAEAGEYMSSFAPFGYDRIKRNETEKAHLEINKEKSMIVGKIFKWYLKHKSLGSVVKELIKAEYNSPKLGKWSTAMVKRILNDTSYIGTYYYGKTERISAKRDMIDKSKITKENWVGEMLPSIINKKKTSLHFKDKKEWIAQSCPAIVDKEFFNEAQKLLIANHHHPRKHKFTYLLTPLLKCSCGAKMSASFNTYKKTGKSYRYYRCDDVRNKKLYGEEYCKHSWVNADLVEKAIWDLCKEARVNPSLFLSFTNEKENRENLANLEAESKQLEEAKIKIQKEQERYLELYGDETYNKATLDKLLEKSKKKLENIEEDIKENEASLSPLQNEEELKYYASTLKLISDSPEKLGKYFDEFSPEEKKGMIAELIDKIVYDKNTKGIKIFGKVKTFLYLGGLLRLINELGAKIGNEKIFFDKIPRNENLGKSERREFFWKEFLKEMNHRKISQEKQKDIRKIYDKIMKSFHDLSHENISDKIDTNKPLTLNLGNPKVFQKIRNDYTKGQNEAKSLEFPFVYTIQLHPKRCAIRS